MTPKEAGQAFLADVLALVPADQQDAARAAFEASEQALTTLGAGYLRQSDYSRQLDAIRVANDNIEAYRGQLETWYAANSARLDAQPAPSAPLAPATPVANPDYLTRAQLEQERKAWESQYAGALAATTSLASKHYAEFQEPLDVEALVRDPEINSRGLAGVYDKLYAARYAEKAKAADTARIEAEVQRRLTAERQANPRHPYPVSGRESSPLDQIEAQFATKLPVDPLKPDVPAISVVDAAIQQYHDAVARHSAGGGA